MLSWTIRICLFILARSIVELFITNCWDLGPFYETCPEMEQSETEILLYSLF